MRMIVFIGVFLAAILGAHAAIYAAAQAAWPAYVPFPAGQVGLVLFLLAVGAVGTLVADAFYNNAVVRFASRFFAAWMGFFVYAFMASAVYGAVVGVAHLFGIPDSFPHLARWLAAAALVITLIGYANAWPLVTRRMTVRLPNLPSAWKGKRAVFISDVHLGQIHTERFARRVAAAVSAARPDAVFIGGDLYDGVKVDEKAIIAPFSGLRPQFGTYFVTGNHEEFSDSTHFLNAVRGAGMIVLMNELVDIHGLQIVGVTDHDSADKKTYEAFMAGLALDRSRPAVLLKHQPSYLEFAEKAGVSLQLSGHTHRAQLFPLNAFTHWIYKGYDYGFKRHGALQIYTSSGVGSWGPPMRIGSRSEIIVIDFE